jgi:hypothetical protein
MYHINWHFPHYFLKKNFIWNFFEIFNNFQVTSNVDRLDLELNAEFIFECNTGRGLPKAYFEWYIDDLHYATNPNETYSVRFIKMSVNAHLQQLKATILQRCRRYTYIKLFFTYWQFFLISLFKQRLTKNKCTCTTIKSQTMYSLAFWRIYFYFHFFKQGHILISIECIIKKTRRCYKIESLRQIVNSATNC